jgi:hypothetical protein
LGERGERLRERNLSSERKSERVGRVCKGGEEWAKGKDRREVVGIKWGTERIDSERMREKLGEIGERGGEVMRKGQKKEREGWWERELIEERGVFGWGFFVVKYVWHWVWHVQKKLEFDFG